MRRLVCAFDVRKPLRQVFSRQGLNVIKRKEKRSQVVCFAYACADPEGDRGSGSPQENHKAIGFLCNTGPESLENHKATKPVFSVGPSSKRQRIANSNGVSLARI